MHLHSNDTSVFWPSRSKYVESTDPWIRNCRAIVQFSIQRQRSSENVRLYHSANVQSYQDAIWLDVQTISTGTLYFTKHNVSTVILIFLSRCFNFEVKLNLKKEEQFQIEISKITDVIHLCLIYNCDHL